MAQLPAFLLPSGYRCGLGQVGLYTALVPDRVAIELHQVEIARRRGTGVTLIEAANVSH